ncbi:MAG: ABC transporter ATP-binding protein, partial [Cellulomonadaceae bacterium]|nr:ABC transporter ATP-binding protein [Cellulomonadaceae bacterium]
MTANVLDVQDLNVSFQTHAGIIQAVRGVSFGLAPGESLAIVGESGSGKSVTARAIMGLLPQNADVTGSIKYLDSSDYKETELTTLPERQYRNIRGNKISMVFQDPMTCLDPTMTIGAQVAEPLRIHGVGRKDANKAAYDILQAVGIPDTKQRMKQYPHQFSGGPRQSIAIAAALIAKPQILLADEPTTALDVRIQAQILDVLR